MQRGRRAVNFALASGGKEKTFSYEEVLTKSLSIQIPQHRWDLRPSSSVRLRSDCCSDPST